MSQCFSSINPQKCTTFHPLGLLQVHRSTLSSTDALLKINIVTCVIHPKINIIQMSFVVFLLRVRMDDEDSLAGPDLLVYR